MKNGGDRRSVTWKTGLQQRNWSAKRWLEDRSSWRSSGWGKRCHHPNSGPLRLNQAKSNQEWGQWSSLALDYPSPAELDWNNVGQGGWRKFTLRFPRWRCHLHHPCCSSATVRRLQQRIPTTGAVLCHAGVPNGIFKVVAQSLTFIIESSAWYSVFWLVSCWQLTRRLPNLAFNHCVWLTERTCTRLSINCSIWMITFLEDHPAASEASPHWSFVACRFN